MSSESSSSNKNTRVGGIVLDGQCNLLLVLGKESQKYGLPKGGLEEGETLLSGALREIHEETGLQLKPDEGQDVQYWAINRARLFILRVDEIQPALCPKDTSEIEMALWLDLTNQEDLSIVESNCNKMLQTVLKKLKSLI